jgi:tetratricopeptide (TPR) repeat protein
MWRQVLSQSPRTAKQAKTPGFQAAVGEFDKMLSRGMSLSGRERNCAFLNLGGTLRRRSGSSAGGNRDVAGGGKGKIFANVSATSGFDFSDDARGVAPVDWDFDGDLDLWLVNRSGPQVRFLRNDSSIGLEQANNWVQFKLEGNGTTTNRDAIGARIEVIVRDAAAHSPNPKSEIQNSKLIKTLRAGEGYLSQHSKWLHVGLGSADQIEHVTVRWPGGGVEQFNAAVNHRYRLVQGTGQAKLWHPPPEPVKLVASVPEQQDSETNAAVFLADPLPLPIVQWQTFGGEAVALQDDGPVLVNLWASWCVPCVAELTAFSRHHRELDEMGLRIVALSVDGLGDHRGTPANAQELVKRLKLPFDTGMADRRLVEALDRLFDKIFQIHESLPIPTSVLLTADRRIVAIYKGTVSVDRLLEDLQYLDADPPQRRERLTPFAGRWITPPRLLPLSSLIIAFLDGEDLDYPLAYAELAIAEKTAMAGNGHTDWDVKLPANLATLAQTLAAAGRLKEAEQMCRQAIAFEPKNAETNFALGEVMLLRNRITHASRQFQVTLRLHPAHADANYRMGWLFMRRGHVDRAVNYFRNALRADPTHQLSLLELAQILSTHWDPQYRDGREALKLAQSACAATAFVDAAALHTLAGAHAEVGAFAEAVRIAQDALIIAEQSEQNQLAEFIRGNLALFQAGRPYHQRKPERR